MLPSASAFIGSDVIAGVYQHALDEFDGAAILIDVGTNGEIVLVKDRALYAASCAAGPALEGARISSGMGGVAGAVSSVFEVDGAYTYTTVDDAPAIGICGAGLCDLAAILLDRGVIDDSGYLEDDFCLVGVHQTKSGAMPRGATSVMLTASDVRELQLAKAAIRAGLDTLMQEADLTEDALLSLFLAGGLGFYLSPDSACRIGMFSKGLRDKIKALGNTALQGAIKALCDLDAIAKMEAIAARVKTVNLNEIAFFSERFMDAIFFEES